MSDDSYSGTTIPGKPAWNIDRIACDTDDPMAMPIPHLEARICDLAGHLEAGTCRYLMLIADFDERQGWAREELSSCAAWLSWKCQVAQGTAREQVRVARSLKTLPVIRGEFAAGRFSYAKVRALTRVATPDTEQELAEFAEPMTAGQLERFVRAQRQIERGDQDGRPACREPKLTWRQDSTGIAISVHLPNEQGAVVLQSLRAFLDGPEPGDDGTETREEALAAADERGGPDWEADSKPFQSEKTRSGDLASALVSVCGEYLSGRAGHAANPDNYQVVIHAGTGTLADAPEPSADVPDVSAETSGPLAFPRTHPAYPWRGHVEDGGAVDPATVRMITCNGTISTMLHDQNGNVLNVGRRTRRPSDALRRAVRERDDYRCRFPGCQSRRTDAHHIVHWAHGGETSLANLLSLCSRHHTIVHETGIVIATGDHGTFDFFLADGTALPRSPGLPGGTVDGLKASHDADLEWHTIIPPHSGERLDLHEAIWICLNNIRTQARRRREQEDARRQDEFAPAT